MALAAEDSRLQLDCARDHDCSCDYDCDNRLRSRLRGSRIEGRGRGRRGKQGPSHNLTRAFRHVPQSYSRSGNVRTHRAMLAWLSPGPLGPDHDPQPKDVTLPHLAHGHMVQLRTPLRLRNHLEVAGGAFSG